jgi:signal peptidase I
MENQNTNPNPTPQNNQPKPPQQPTEQPQPTPVVAPTNVPQPMPTPTPIQQPTPISNPPGSQAKPKEEKKKKSGIFSFAATIVVALLLTQIINMFFFQSYRVFGNSMYPTLNDGDRLIVSKVSETVSNVTNNSNIPERGDIIVFTSPKEDDLQLIKRVIGLPGERVVVKDGKITVYNSQHPRGFNPDDEDYGENLPKTSGQADVTVPENHVFVSGDNRIGSNSLDSRNELGTVSQDLIIGTASVRLWPFQTATFF